MKCHRARGLISARIDQEISLGDDEALRLHLDRCARCRDRLETVRRLDQSLVRAFAPQREESAALTDRILTHLAAREPAIQPRCSVLVVDNNPDVLDVLEKLLGREHDVEVAGSAAEAQRLFGHKRIDVILTDQRMPGMTGVQLLEWVFQNHPRTMRLLMTGYAEFDEAIEAINRGHVFRYVPKPFSPVDGLLAAIRDAVRMFQLERDHDRILKELRALNQDLEWRVAQRTRQLRKANAELEQKSQMLERLALNDALTGLPNRRALDYLMERELRWRERYPAPLAVAILDVDHFKEVNTRYLHPGGDKVLQDLARCLTSSLRKIDLLGRMSGEEFLLIAPQTNLAGARIVAERLRAQVEGQVFTYRDQVIPVRVSIGVAVLELGVTADYEQVKLAAAAALKRAKDLGRNRVEVDLLAPPAEEPPAAGSAGVASA
jgi:diguanylate cyclase (GGDEF)-like protein